MKKITYILMFVFIGLANKTMCQNSYLVNENFDSYPVGTFPTTLVLKYPGFGAQLQVVTNSNYVSSSNSLKLEGRANNAANVDINLSSTPDVIWLEVMVNTSKLDTPSYPNYPIAVVGFNNEERSSYGNGYGCVYFGSGSIAAAGTTLQTFNEGQWYKVKIKYYAVSNKMDVWIDDVLKGSNINISGNTAKYNSVLLVGGNASHTKCFFDDVKVWDDNNIPTGINKTKETNSIQLYPNSSAGIITVKSPITLEPKLISIYDIQGHLLLQQPLNGESTDVDISTLPKGVYVAKVGNKEGISTHRWIKE